MIRVSPARAFPADKTAGQEQRKRSAWGVPPSVQRVADGAADNGGGPRQSVVCMVAAMTDMLHLHQHRWLVKPDSPRMAQWDLFMAIMLAYIALLSPYEISFLKFGLETTGDIALFVVNRIVDLCFLADMTLQFFLMFYEKPKGGGISNTHKYGVLVHDRKRIALRYVKGWFLLDLISTVPFDLLALVINEGDVSSSSAAVTPGEDSTQKLKLIRIVRLLRLLKLLRILRASRVFMRLESRISISYALLNIVKFLMLMFVFSHWSACLWALVGSLQDQTEVTWITKWMLSRMANGVTQMNQQNHALCLSNIPAPLLANTGSLTQRVDADGKHYTRNGAFWANCYYPSEIYFASIYWSVMTLTSIGYGDIVPVNRAEHIFVIFCMVMGGVCWAYILGSICASASNLNPAKAEFQRTMDDLNRFMARRGIDDDMQERFRAYFINARSAVHESTAQHLMERMSPALAAECVAASHPHLRHKVFFLKNCSRSFMVSVVAKFRTETFGPSESTMRTQTMMVLQRGVLSLGGRLMLPGSVWGEDMVLTAAWLRRRTRLFTLTFVELSSLTSASLQECLEQHPRESPNIRRTVLPFMLKRAASTIGKMIVAGTISGDKGGVMRAIREASGVTEEADDGDTRGDEEFDSVVISSPKPKGGGLWGVGNDKAADPLDAEESMAAAARRNSVVRRNSMNGPTKVEVDPATAGAQIKELKDLILQMSRQQQDRQAQHREEIKRLNNKVRTRARLPHSRPLRSRAHASAAQAYAKRVSNESTACALAFCLLFASRLISWLAAFRATARAKSRSRHCRGGQWQRQPHGLAKAKPSFKKPFIIRPPLFFN